MRKSTSVQNPGPATAESSEGPPSSTGVPHRHRAGCNSQDRHGGGGDPRHWQPGTFSRRRRSCDSLHNTGDSGSDREAWTGTPFHSGARCFQRQGGSKRHGGLGSRRPPAGTASRCSGTVLLYRPGFAGIRPLCKLQMKPKLSSAPLPAGTGCAKMAVGRLFYP